MFMEETNAKKFEDLNLKKLRTDIAIGKSQETTLDANRVLNHKGRIRVHRVDDLNKKLLTESHALRYSIHPGVTKMYSNLKLIWWLSKMKKDITKFMVKCRTSQQ